MPFSEINFLARGRPNCQPRLKKAQSLSSLPTSDSKRDHQRKSQNETIMIRNAVLFWNARYSSKKGTLRSVERGWGSGGEGGFEREWGAPFPLPSALPPGRVGQGGRSAGRPASDTGTLPAATLLYNCRYIYIRMSVYSFQTAFPTLFHSTVFAFISATYIHTRPLWLATPTPPHRRPPSPTPLLSASAMAA